MKPHLASFIDAITQIINHIRANWPTYGSRGRVAVNIRGGYRPHTVDGKKKFLVAEMKKFFNELVSPIQAVVVVTTGENVEGSSGPMETSINSYPALFSRDFYILTVGAVMASASGPKNGQPWP